MPLSSLQSNRFNRSMNDLGNSGSSKTIALPENYNAMLTCSLSANCTFTMPSPVNGYQFSLLLKQDATGGRTATFTNVKWPNSTAPTISTSGFTMDIINFFSDGTNWYGYLGNSQNFDGYSGLGDKYFNSVALLLHMDGTGSSFVDSSPTPKTITAVGSASQSAIQSKWGSKSLLIDSVSKYLSLSSSGFSFSGNFTMECWVYMTGSASSYVLLEGRSDPNAYQDFVWYLDRGGYNGFVVSSSGGRFDGTSAIVSQNQWTHVALVRSNGVFSAYVNGVRDTLQVSYSGTITPANSILKIGSNAQNNFSGYIDDFRITIGVARYTTASFSVPTAAFSDSI